MKKYLLIAASLLLSLPLAAAVQKVSLNSDGRVAAWQLRAQDEVTDVKAMLGAGYDASGWVAAVVPGAAFTSFVEAGIEPDPNFGDNAYKVTGASTTAISGTGPSSRPKTCPPVRAAGSASRV